MESLGLDKNQKVPMPSVCVVLPAAGVGERMSLPSPKQFCNVLGRPLISYTIESFEKIPWISCVVIVVSKEYIQRMQEILEKFSHQRAKLVEGSSTRHRSIYSGVLAVDRECRSGEIVVIHDAVRPFVDEQIVRAVVEAALQSGAAGVVRPLVSTVVATDLEGFLDHSLDRSKYRSSEMPQAFAVDVIKKAYEKCTDYDLDYGTECLHLVQRYAGIKVRLVDGPEHLWKVTYRRDLYAVEGVLKESCLILFIIKEECIAVAVKEILAQSLSNKLGDGASLVSCHYEELNRLSSSRCLTTGVVISYANMCTAEDIKSSTENVLQRLQQANVTSAVTPPVIHLIISQCYSNESLLEMMSATRRSCDGDSGRMVNTVLTSNEGLSKASNIVTSLIVDRNVLLAGQTFVV